MKVLSPISRLLLCAVLLSSSACDKRESKVRITLDPSSSPSGQQSLRDELIASLQTDLNQLRGAEKSEKSALYSLAQALDQIMKEDSPSSFSLARATWNAAILTYGSKKSGDLSNDYLRMLLSNQAETSSNFDKVAKETATRIADRIFIAKTPQELDAPLLEINSLLSQTSGTGNIHSTSGQLLLFKQFVATWQEFLTQVESAQNAEAMRCLERLKSFAPPIHWLNPVSVTQALQTASQTTGIPSSEQLDSMIKSLVERAISATKPEDLDSLLVETGKLRSFRSELPEKGNDRVTTLQNLIENIQVGLFAQQTKDYAKWREFVSRIENQDLAKLGIPRSRFLLYVYHLKQSLSATEAKPLSPAGSPAEAAARMTSLETIVPHLTALQLALDSDPSIPFTSSWRLDLMSLQTMATRFEQLMAGKGMQRAVHESGLQMINIPAIVELQRQFDILCLNITFAEDAQLLPNEKESARDYTARLKTKLARLEKWEALQTLYTATRAIKIKEPVINHDDDNAVSGLLYGLRLAQEAKDLRMGTCALQTVLTSPSKLVPASLVGKYLEEIRKSDPLAYQQGNALALNISKAEGKRAPGERAQALQWVIPSRKPRVN